MRFNASKAMGERVNVIIRDVADNGTLTEFEAGSIKLEEFAPVWRILVTPRPATASENVSPQEQEPAFGSGEGARTLLRGLDILLIIAEFRTPPSFGDLQRETGIAKATLSRLLTALRSRKLIYLDQRTRRYSPGSRVLDLTRRTLDKSALMKAAKPELARLAARLGRPIVLMLPDGDEVFVLDFEDPDARNIRLVRVWPRQPLADTAAGLALLSARADAPGEVESSVAVNLAKALGYAVHHAKSDSGLPVSVAAPITDAGDHPIGAISCLFETADYSAEQMHEAGRMISDAARRASGNVTFGELFSFARAEPAQPPEPDLEVMKSHRDFNAENPIWSQRRQTLFWLDTLAPALRWLKPESGQTGRVDLPDLFGGMALAPDGKLILAGRPGVCSFDFETEQLSLMINPERDQPHMRFNTANVDRQGALWAGTMPLDLVSSQGRLYRIGVDLNPQIKLPTIYLPKNVDWSPDGSELYVSDGKVGVLFAFDVKEGAADLSEPRVLVQGNNSVGNPNGIAVDVEGGIWTAMLGGWAVHRYWPDGTLDKRISLPIPMPTNVAFAGADLHDLYITSTYLRVPPDFSDRATLSGRLFRYRVETPGFPTRLFGMGSFES